MNKLLQNELLNNPWEIWIEYSDDPAELPVLYIFGDVPLDRKNALPILEKRKAHPIPGQLHLQIVYTPGKINLPEVEVMYAETLDADDHYTELFIHSAGVLVHYQKSFEKVFRGSGKTTTRDL